MLQAETKLHYDLQKGAIEMFANKPQRTGPCMTCGKKGQPLKGHGYVLCPTCKEVHKTGGVCEAEFVQGSGGCGEVCKECL